MKNFVVQKLDGTVLAIVKANYIDNALLQYCQHLSIRTDNNYLVSSTCIEFTHCCISYTIKEVHTVIVI